MEMVAGFCYYAAGHIMTCGFNTPAGRKQKRFFQHLRLKVINCVSCCVFELKYECWLVFTSVIHAQDAV